MASSVDRKRPARSVASEQWLPFASLNLLRNPFGELTREDRVKAAVVDDDGWLDLLRSDQCALQFMGDCGRGKTTHLLALLRHFPDGVYLYLPEDEPNPPIPIGAPLLIDEAQRLSWRQRQNVFHRPVPLVLGTHVDLSRRLIKCRRRVETIDVTLRGDRTRLRCVLNRRVELARLRPGPVPQVSFDDVDILIRRFADDIRSMEEYLYDRFEELKGAADGQLRIVDRVD